ncbi:MAG: riboflavin synthase [bacterium]|nr:riboflavin synthase [bacterium]
MFTGIIEEKGTIRTPLRGRAGRMSVRADKALEETEIGDSVAVNGVCLTVVELGGGYFSADVSKETAKRSTLGDLRTGQAVNLERAARVGQAIGGHIVQGHVDEAGVAKVITDNAGTTDLRVTMSPSFRKYFIEKGSVAVDGISLTISSLYDDGFGVSLIPHTVEETNLKDIKGERPVNIEVDMFAKYIYNYVSGLGGKAESTSKVNEAFLAENGFI